MAVEQKLINKILSDGKKKADEILKKAEEESLQILKKAKEDEAKFVKEKLDKEKQDLEKKLAYKKELNNLEKNKALLKAKFEVIDEIFALVLQKLNNLKASEYSKFLESVLTKAQNEDKLIVSSKKGEKEKISKLEIFKKKKLSILKESDDFSGGVIIVGKIFDLDFSFESLVKEKYESSLSNIAKNLF